MYYEAVYSVKFKGRKYYSYAILHIPYNEDILYHIRKNPLYYGNLLQPELYALYPCKTQRECRQKCENDVEWARNNNIYLFQIDPKTGEIRK